jgi:hypothetical protein
MEKLKFAVACCGPGLVVFHVYLFKNYFEAGKPLPVGLHIIALNNHGVNRYITEAQSHNLDLSLGAAVVMLIVFFGLVLAKIRKGRGEL